MIGLGTYRLPPATARDITACAVTSGYMLIDTAQLYRNETAVHEGLSQSGVESDSVFLTTKVKTFDPVAIEERLKIFGKIDLLLLHWPSDHFVKDWENLCKNKPPSVKNIGVSNFDTQHLEQIRDLPRPFCNQIEISPFLTRKELIAYHRLHSILTVAHSPLIKGEKFNDQRLMQMAEKYSTTTASILINWSLQNQFWVIPRTSNVQHLKQNQCIVRISESDIVEMDSWNESYATHPKYIS